MASEICTDDVVVRITPQIISSETVATGGRVAASSAAVELGRRLLLAARAGDTPRVLRLMAEGAPFTTDWLGTSALHMAAGGGHAGTCAVLLRAGVSRDARTKVERTPLHLAAYGGHAAAAALLLDAGAQPDARDMLRMTPLHWAAQRGHAAAATALLAAGADPLARSKFGKSARDLAQDAAVRSLLDDAARQREAARSVRHLVLPPVTEQLSESPSSDPQSQTFEAVKRIQEVKPSKIKIQADKVVKTEIKNERDQEGAAAALLRQHGITLLPTDDTGTVLSALQSGRTVVLSDAGKLMLKESNESSPALATSKPSVATHPPKNMVLTATPVKSPPKPGMKIFTLNNKLLAIPKDGKRVPVKRIINPQDMQHVKLVQLAADGRVVGAGASRRVGGGAPVKIIMNKSNFQRLVGGARPAPAQAGGGEETEGSVRAQLAAAQRTVAALTAELLTARRQLQRYEQQHTHTQP